MVSINALALLKKFASGKEVKRPASEHIRELVTLRAIEWGGTDWIVTDAGEDLLTPKKRGRQSTPEMIELARQVMYFLGQTAKDASPKKLEACQKLASKLPAKPAWNEYLGEDIRLKDEDEEEDEEDDETDAQ
jgi:hypothetical protein